MTFTIQRKYLLGLANWLNSLSLAGVQSRARTKFVRVAASALDRVDKERLEILEEYAEKDKDGKPKKKTDEKTGQESFVVPDDKLPEFNKEISELYDQDAELTEPEFSMSLVVLRNLVLNTEEKIGPQIADQYDKWCEAFEKIQVS